MATWNLAGIARNDFVDMMEALTPQQLSERSLCSEWTARGVACHLASFVETGGFAFFGNVAKTGFNFDKASSNMVNKQMARPFDEVLASLRAKSTKSAALPMFPEELTVADVAIHTQDVRRPLRLGGQLDPAVLNSALDFVTSHKMAKMLLPTARPIDGLKLVATDMDWSHGEGAEITGPGEAILMAIADRPLAGGLAGEGLKSWS